MIYKTWIIIISILSVNLIATQADATPVRVVELQGEAIIKRDGETYKVFVNSPLLLGDILFPKEGARVVVDCGDERKVLALSGIPSGVRGICPQIGGTDPRDIKDIFLALLNGTMVYQTEVLDENPILRWPSLGNSKRYQVQIKFNETIVWEKEVEGEQVLYDGQPLRHKAFYDLVVTPINNQMEEEYVLRIRRIDPFISEQVSQDISVIKSEQLGDEAKALILVNYYQKIENNGLLWQALSVLEKVVKEGNTSVASQALLGNLYLALGRNDEAKKQYLEVIERAENEQNWQAWASGKEGLAHLAVISQNEREAQQLLTEAQKGYQLSGNQKRREVMEDWLLKLKNSSLNLRN